MSQFLTSIQTQLNNTDSVLDAIEVQSEAMVDGLMAKFTASNVSIERDTVAEVMTALTTLLKNERDQLDQAESEVVAEAADDKAPLDTRNAATSDLKGHLTQTRTFIVNHSASSTLNTYGLSAPPPANTSLLATYTRKAINLLKTRPQDFNAFGVVVPSASLATNLETSVTQLDAASANVSKEKRELDLVRDKRNIARNSFEQTYSGVVSIVAALLDLSNRPGLAERLRPTARRVRGEEPVVLSDPPDSPEDGDAPEPGQPEA